MFLFCQYSRKTKSYIFKRSGEHVQTKVSAPIIKAIRVKQDADFLLAQQLSCDLLLLDAYLEKEYGGTGKTFNWNFAKDFDKPFFLAGGIHLGNALSAIEYSNPYCLDASSGVETNGFKDRNKIIQLVKLIRSVR